MLPRLVPLLARRAAELPRYRVRAQLPSTPGHGAELEFEPLAWQVNRAGDVPFDWIPKPVPANERTPKRAGELGPSEAAGWRAIERVVPRIRQSGVSLAEGELRALQSLEDELTRPGIDGLEEAVRTLGELRDQLDLYDAPAARALGEEIEDLAPEFRAIGYPQL